MASGKSESSVLLNGGYLKVGLVYAWTPRFAGRNRQVTPEAQEEYSGFSSDLRSSGGHLQQNSNLAVFPLPLRIIPKCTTKGEMAPLRVTDITTEALQLEQEGQTWLSEIQTHLGH